MLTHVCPHCGALSLFKIVWSDERSSGNHVGATVKHVAALVCVACGLPISGVLNQSRSTIERVWPETVGGKAFPDVPAQIADAADEAYRCSSIGARRAAVLLARSVIEATAKDKQITSGTLLAKIDALYAQGFIREHIKDGAHEVRHLGNEMAHGDFVEPVDSEDLDLTLTLMGEVLEEVFQSPARVKRAQDKRAAKAAGTAT
ncbi:DUF4145 domain-containing protein [Micromonospora sp. NPDC049274]|uniref:DUF4145 domain-containing protein n=1 Tax=Micromonospora sp. NPDC049274 TaxID=3154829 RepID=UPI0034333971